MKSKISFFNKTIFWKNVTLYWPIWGIYTLACFIQQPVILWITNMSGNMMVNGYTAEQRLQDLITCLYFEPYVVIIAFAALITGMALYSYMYNQKSANMIHSLPVDRTQLYGTTLISGWAFLIVPLFATALLTTLICLVYGVPGIPYVWAWFGCVACLAFIAFALVSICALFTGHIVVLPMYAFAVSYASWIVYYLVNVIVTTFGFGVTLLGDRAEEITRIFCPPQCFYHNLSWMRRYDEMHQFIGIDLMGGEFLILYMIVAVVLYGAAYVIYRKRKIEQAGDFLTVNWVKPIFRAIVGCVGAIFGAMIIREVLIDVNIGCGMPAFVIVMLIIGAICYFAADMFIKKSFHVFKKRDWLRCGIFSVVLLVVFFGMYGLAEIYENDVPELDEVEYAEIHMGYEITMYGEDVATIMEIQKDILAQADYIENQIESGNRYYNMVRVRYYLEDGHSITRRYPLPQEDQRISPIYEKIMRLEEDKENYLVNLFGKDYANITTFYSGRLEAYFIDPEDRNTEGFYPDTNYDSKKLDETQTKEIYEAIIADVKAGTLMKYNVYDGKYIYAKGADVDYYKASEVHLSLEYQLPEDDSEDKININENSYGDYAPIVDEEYVDYQKQRSVYLNFGPDCENIINKLIKFGMIESAEDIWWGEAEELLKVETY